MTYSTDPLMIFNPWRSKSDFYRVLVPSCDFYGLDIRWTILYVFMVLFHQSGWYISANGSIFCCLVLANQVFSNQLCRGKIPRICCQGGMARDFVDIHLVFPGWDHLKPNHCFSKHQHQMQRLMDEPYVPILHYLMQREIF